MAYKVAAAVDEIRHSPKADVAVIINAKSLAVAQAAHLFDGSVTKLYSLVSNLNLAHLTDIDVPAVHTAHFPVLVPPAATQKPPAVCNPPLVISVSASHLVAASQGSVVPIVVLSMQYPDAAVALATTKV